MCPGAYLFLFQKRKGWKKMAKTADKFVGGGDHLSISLFSSIHYPFEFQENQREGQKRLFVIQMFYSYL